MPPRVSLEMREARFRDLVQFVQACRACPRMEGRRRVLSDLNGKVGTAVMFVAEAPGRHGADRTGVPIHGDATGVNFERLLASIGWKREEVFITNGVLCNPRDEGGKNASPNPSEQLNCSFHLEATIRLVSPLVIATLGQAALQTLSLIEPHEIYLRGYVAKPTLWAGRIVFPLYHPSPRALLHRDMEKQREDFMSLRRLVQQLRKPT